MSEGWEDCPVLPVGWKRREVFRRSGATIGKSDTYYLSPTAERFRSKVELVKYFGDALDLTYFDFKKGIILPPDAKVRRSGKRQSTSSCEVKEEQRDRCQTPKKKAKAPPTPSPAQPKPEKASEAEGLAADPQDSLIVCCEDCQQWIPGVLFSPRKRRLRFYCAECRAKRRELGRKLNYYKKEIKAESRCRRSSGEPKKKVKSHLQTTKRTVTQRPEPAYVTSEDKDGAPCKVPTRKIQSHQQAEKILKRAKINPVPKEPEVEEEKPVVKPCPPLSEEPAPESPDTPTAVTADTPVQTKGSRNRRNNRSCGECEACLRLADCGTCDFCKDKAKFGGANTLRQKCRWKQCLCFASVSTSSYSPSFAHHLSLLKSVATLAGAAPGMPLGVLYVNCVFQCTCDK
ncbi:methyl-CpG-binding domain protein 1-like isoform X2 [Mobula birostris]|uniref:methyl-CpG-binding domain protein 1-like isoform X2 n=1 Tax=Mobula birostris TaxID=1983395 RepID=UPI003B27F78B